MVKRITNPFLTEVNLIRGIKGIDGIRYSAQLNAAGNADLFDTAGSDITIQTLEYGCNDDQQCYMHITPYLRTGVLDTSLLIPLRDGSGSSVMTPFAVETYGCSYLDSLVYDGVNNWYRVGLNRPLRFPNGLRLRIVVTGAFDMYATTYISIQGEN